VECIASRALSKRDWLSSTRYTRKARYSGIQVGFILPLFGEGLIDLADEYGDSEDLLGKWFAAKPEKRKDIFLATKFGMRSKPAELKKGLVIDSSPEYYRKALERSLGRLGLPYVDLYYVHRLDKITPIEKTIEALVELKNAGKIKHLGLSECSAETLRRALRCTPHNMCGSRV
jgi:aryl-alcohol dehydrogenase-like predicted oxidoreductase